MLIYLVLIVGKILWLTVYAFHSSRETVHSYASLHYSLYKFLLFLLLFFCLLRCVVSLLLSPLWTLPTWFFFFFFFFLICKIVFFFFLLLLLLLIVTPAVYPRLVKCLQPSNTVPKCLFFSLYSIVLSAGARSRNILSWPSSSKYNFLVVNSYSRRLPALGWMPSAFE